MTESRGWVSFMLSKIPAPTRLARRQPPPAPPGVEPAGARRHWAASTTIDGGGGGGGGGLLGSGHQAGARLCEHPDELSTCRIGTQRVVSLP